MSLSSIYLTGILADKQIPENKSLSSFDRLNSTRNVDTKSSSLSTELHKGHNISVLPSSDFFTPFKIRGRVSE